MSSRDGPRAAGSDGSDFRHREKVANHYQVSATSKWRLRFVTYLHIWLFTMMFARLSTSMLVILGIRPPLFLQKMKLPRAQTWEFVWLVSVIPSIIALFAIKKNRAFLMQQYLIGIVVFGVLPLLYAMFDLSDDLMAYWNTKKAALQLLGFPLVVLWYMFAAVALQVHLFGAVFAWQLIKAWNPKKKAF